MPNDSHPASRAEPPSSPRLARITGAVVVLLVLGGLVSKLSAPKRTNVPNGIAGVKLGSTLDEVKAVLPALAPLASGGSGEPPPAPHARHQARVLLFDEPATCSLDLAVDERLSRIDCVVDTAPGAEPSPKLRAKLLATLRELYGKESRSSETSWLWQNDRARLLLHETASAPSAPPGPATLRLSCWSRAHESREVPPPVSAAPSAARARDPDG